MILFDDKTKDVIKNGTQLVIPTVNVDDDITFQASYVVAADLKCSGKITALFDLIVFGNVYAEEIDIKGRFVCMGNCTINKSLIVQNDIWGEDIQAKSINCHDRIVAQSIDAEVVIADGNIIIGKILAIEQKAQTSQKMVCGETAYGSGKIIASSILTTEPIDLDDGEEALESPFQYIPQTVNAKNQLYSKELDKFKKTNDYVGLLEKLMITDNMEEKKKFKRYLTVLKTTEIAYANLISEIQDLSLLIWLLEISDSDYFKEWDVIAEWTEDVLSYFKNRAEGKINDLQKSQPATELKKGDIVLHQKYGKGIVCALPHIASNGKSHRMLIVDFELYGEKKFPLPGSLKFFSIVNKEQAIASDDFKATMYCDIDSYSEWLLALQLTEQYRERLGLSLYNIINDLLLAKLGLKPKFIEDRFKEKGWG